MVCFVPHQLCCSNSNPVVSDRRTSLQGCSGDASRPPEHPTIRLAKIDTLHARLHTFRFHNPGLAHLSLFAVVQDARNDGVS
jgi:hypothetical protein